MPVAVGVLGAPLPSVSRTRLENLVALRLQGVSCVGIYMTAWERSAPTRWAARLRARLLESEMHCLYVVGPLANLTEGSADARRLAVAETAQTLRAGAALGAERVLIGPGSRSSEGPWHFHPSNFSRDSRNALIRSLRELGLQASQLGVGITVEGHQSTVLESPAVMRQMLDEADSPVVGASLDYVNFLTPPLFARFRESLLQMLDALGPRLTALHVKDAVVRPRLALHIDELPAGDGDLDLREVVTVAKRKRVPVVLEHLPRRRAESAIGHITRLASTV